jgi:Rrf2 family protein
MRMSEGVEWALHSCLALVWLEDEAPLSTATLAAAFDLPSPYLNKQLQALAREGIVASTPGPRGGFRLAKPAEEITLLDVVAAIEGPDDPFQCQEIRQYGAMRDAPRAEFRQECVVAAAMRTADVAWRKALREQTIADIQSQIDGDTPVARQRMRDWHRSTKDAAQARRRPRARARD